MKIIVTNVSISDEEKLRTIWEMIKAKIISNGQRQVNANDRSRAVTILNKVEAIDNKLDNVSHQVAKVCGK